MSRHSYRWGLGCILLKISAVSLSTGSCWACSPAVRAPSSGTADTCRRLSLGSDLPVLVGVDDAARAKIASASLVRALSKVDATQSEEMQALATTILANVKE